MASAAVASFDHRACFVRVVAGMALVLMEAEVVLDYFVQLVALVAVLLES